MRPIWVVFNDMGTPQGIGVSLDLAWYDAYFALRPLKKHVGFDHELETAMLKRDKTAFGWKAVLMTECDNPGPEEPVRDHDAEPGRGNQ